METLAIVERPTTQSIKLWKEVKMKVKTKLLQEWVHGERYYNTSSLNDEDTCVPTSLIFQFLGDNYIPADVV
jgi:hypothetical protein